MKLSVLKVVGLLCLLLFSTMLKAEEMRLAVTTSFHNSGLSDVLLPAIEKDLGLRVHLLVVGTGQALKLGRQGDVDAILVHSRDAEEEFIKAGFASHRREIMYNDFVFVGAKEDKTGIGSAKDAVEVLQLLEEKHTEFVSRGDDSGTHRKELALWQKAGLNAEGFSSDWYKAAGAGMGATLNLASALNAYVLTDRASWLNFANKRELTMLFAGDPVLFNQYAYLPVSQLKHRHVKLDLATALENWLSSARGQFLIGDYKLKGEPLFTPNAQ